jgi:hypothetical protein
LVPDDGETGELALGPPSAFTLTKVITHNRSPQPRLVSSSIAKHPSQLIRSIRNMYLGGNALY